MRAAPAGASRARTDLIRIYQRCELDTETLCALLFTVDTDALDYKPLARYVEAISATDDPRAAPTIERLITRALDDLQRQPNEETHLFAQGAGELLVAEMEMRVDPDLRRRAAKFGIHW